MIGDLKPYAEYKESGLPWLGPVPAHWQTVRNGSLFGQRSQTGYVELPILEVSLKTGVQVRSLGQAGRKQIMSDPGKYKRAVKGDLAYNTMRMWQGALGVCPVDGLVSPAYVVARPYPGVDAGYFAALFRTGDYMAEIDSASRGIVKDRNRLYWDQFKQMQSPCPPLGEQVAIMRFLAWANGRLERTIRAKRRVIALLIEQKQVIIHRAVTRGIDQNVILKPSGIHSLGDIPKHWGQNALWTVGQQRTERNPNDLPLLSVFLDRGVIRYEDGGGQVHAPSLSLASYQVVRVGDFVLNNQQAWRGSVGVSSYNGIVSPAYIVLQLSSRFDQKFANYLLRSKAMVNQFLIASKGVGDIQRSVFWPFLRMVQVPLPPINEQRFIVAHIESATAGLDKKIARYDREIDLIREYRARLFSDLVTGKVNVCKEAMGLPDEPALDTGGEPADDLNTVELTDEETEA